MERVSSTPVGAALIYAPQATDAHGTLDVKPSNALVNYGRNDSIRFTEVQLADFGSTVHEDSGHARDSDLIGTPILEAPKHICR